MAGQGSFSKLCSGNVPPSRFVVLMTDGTVQLAGANADVWGISQPSTHNPPMVGLDDGFAGTGTPGQPTSPPINIYGPGDDEAPLELGGTVNAGQRIKSDATGRGVVCTTTGDAAGAIAVVGGILGDVIPVKPMRFDTGAGGATLGAPIAADPAAIAEERAAAERAAADLAAKEQARRERDAKQLADERAARVRDAEERRAAEDAAVPEAEPIAEGGGHGRRKGHSHS